MVKEPQKRALMINPTAKTASAINAHRMNLSKVIVCLISLFKRFYLLLPVLPSCSTHGIKAHIPAALRA